MTTARVVVGRHGEDDLLFTLMRHPFTAAEVLRVEHQCTRSAISPACSVYLPLSGPKSWTVVSRDPLTIHPAIQCFDCELHGFIRDGEWRATLTTVRRDSKSSGPIRPMTHPAYEQGRHDERAAVVAYLRSCAAEGDGVDIPEVRTACVTYITAADLISEGAHVNGQ